MRFNHMELTLAPGELDEKRRSEICRFYDEVLGWQSSTVPILGQDALLLAADEAVSQFILVAESPKPMQSPGYDHLGLLMESRAEVDGVLDRCQKFQLDDPRVEIKEYPDLEQGVVRVHAFYLKYLLPIWFDVQSMEWQPGAEPRSRWTFG